MQFHVVHPLIANISISIFLVIRLCIKKKNNVIQSIKSPLGVSYAKINLASINTRLDKNNNKDS